MVDQVSMTSRRGKRAALAIALLTLTFATAASAAPAGGAPQLNFQPGGHDFGLQQVNSTSQTTFQLRNDGEVPAPIHTLETAGPDSGSFWLNGDCWGRTLEPGESCSLQVYFGPGDARAYTAQVRATSDEGTSFVADLEGEGGRPHLTPASDPTNFGSVPVGSAGVTRTIEVVNTGNMAGGAFIAVVAGGAVGSFQLLDESCTNVLLSPAGSCNLLVRFQPLGTGVKTARLGLFGDSDGGTQITLTGVGLDPEPAPSPAAAGPGTSVTDIAPRLPRRRGGKLKPRHRTARRFRTAVGSHRPIG